MLNQSEPNVILTAHATEVNRPEPNWTEPQTCLAGRNHALSHSRVIFSFYIDVIAELVINEAVEVV